MHSAPARLPCLLLAASLSACAGAGKLIGAPLDRPRVHLESWEATGADLEGVTLALHLRIENPNAVGLRLDGLAYRLDVEGRQALTGSVDGGLAIPSRGTAPVVLPLRLRYASVPAVATSVFAKDELHWRAEVTVRIRTPVGALDVPLAQEGKVRTPALPHVGLRGIGVGELSLSGLSVEVRLEVENPNAFPLPAGSVSFELQVNGAPLLSARTRPFASVGPKRREVVAVPVKLSFSAAGDAAKRLARGEAEFVVDGSVALGAHALPFRAEARLTPGK